MVKKLNIGDHVIIHVRYITGPLDAMIDGQEATVEGETDTGYKVRLTRGAVVSVEEYEVEKAS